MPSRRGSVSCARMANSFEPFRSRDSRSFSEIPRRRSASERLVFSPMCLSVSYGCGGEMEEADLFFVVEKTMRGGSSHWWIGCGLNG